MEWEFEWGTQTPSFHSHTLAPFCPGPPPQMERQPLPPGSASAPWQGHAVTGFFPSEPRHPPPPPPLLLRDTALYQSHQPAEGRAGGCVTDKHPLPKELKIRSTALTPHPAWNLPCALRAGSGSSGSSSYAPHQSSSTGAVNMEAAGGGIQLPSLDI